MLYLPRALYNSPWETKKDIGKTAGPYKRVCAYGQATHLSYASHSHTHALTLLPATACAAFFRGKYTCSHMWEQLYGLRDACPRNALAYMSERDRRAGNATALDVGLTQTLPETRPESSIPYRLGEVGADHRSRWCMHACVIRKHQGVVKCVDNMCRFGISGGCKAGLS